MHGNCTTSDRVDGVLLLSFAQDDELLMVGGGFMSLTLAFTTPLFVGLL